MLAVEPELLGARVGHAHTQLDRREYAAAQSEIKSLKQIHSDDTGVIGLDQRWAVHNKSELRAEGYAGESDGETFGSDQYTVDAFWFTRPIDHRYRVFVHTHDGFAEFREGDSSRHRVGAGVEYRYARWLARTELSASRSDDTQLGLRGSVDWRANDFWTIVGVFDFTSNATPLRGHRVGVDSNVAGVRARYAPSELAGVEFGVRYQDFSDGNERMALSADGRGSPTTVRSPHTRAPRASDTRRRIDDG